jgi:hypothetical protein
MADASSDARVGPTSGSGYAPLPVAVVLYLGLTALLLWLALARTGGEFTYAQDDPYIHLAMARTLAEHGVWGIRPYEFASASSSPLWTILLAGLWKAGARVVWMPFAVNVVCGCLLLAFVSSRLRLLTAHGDEPHLAVPHVAVLAAIVVATPLPLLAFIGMEHTLQALLTTIFAWQTSVRLAGQRDDWAGPSLIAAAMVATRYESLFLVVVAGALLVWQRRPRPALIVGVVAAIPVLLFAWYCVVHGGLVLPNSVLMKSGPSRFASLGAGLSAVLSDWVAVGALFQRPVQLSLTLATLLAFLLVPVERLNRDRVAPWLAGVFLGTSVLHACLVKLEWFYRYEAYLVVLGVMSVAAVIPLVRWPAGQPRKRRTPLHPATMPVLVLLALPLGARALGGLAVTPTATANIYEQQVQLGRFFGRHYPDGSIAVNDLGAVAWLSSSRILDIVGLATQEVADLKRARGLTADTLGRLVHTRQVEAIAVYEDIFAPILPASWVKVGEWTIEDNVAVSGTIVAFLAPNEAKAERLGNALDAFASELPPGVRWSRNTKRLPAEISQRP